MWVSPQSDHHPRVLPLRYADTQILRYSDTQILRYAGQSREPRESPAICAGTHHNQVTL